MYHIIYLITNYTVYYYSYLAIAPATIAILLNGKRKKINANKKPS